MIREREKRVETVLSKIDSGAHIIVFDGPCASGKTTLSQDIASIRDVNVIKMDDFFLPMELRTKERFKEKGGNIHYERFIEEVIRPIKEKRDISYRVFSCSTMDYVAVVNIPFLSQIIVEGSYALHPKFEKYWDYAFFLSIDSEEQIRRLKERSPEKIESFVSTWIPLENEYFSSYSIEKRADFIL